MCVFPIFFYFEYFLVLFFKRLKVVDRASLLLSPFSFADTRLFFVIFICFFFWNQSVTLFLLAVTISTFFVLFQLSHNTQNTRVRSLALSLSLSSIYTVCFECLSVCIYVSLQNNDNVIALYVCVCLLGLSFPLEVKKRLHRILLHPTSFTIFIRYGRVYYVFFRGKTAHF